jgi:anti-sigma factor RsiW
MKNCEECRGLLVGLLDHELTPEETREVNEHLIRCAGCRAEHERLRETTGRLSALSYQEPGDEVLSRVWRRPYSRLARNASLALVIGGYALLLGYAAFEFFTRGREALPVKVAVAAIGIGFLTLLLLLVWERVTTYSSDPYKEIER